MSSESHLLDKLKDLESFEFLDDAEAWYRKISQPPYSEKARHTAFISWTALLKRQGKISEAASVQELFLEAFPSQVPSSLRKDIFEYYLSVWQWAKLEALEIGRAHV